MKLVFATRKSALALAQSRAFVAELSRAAGGGLSIEELHVTTSGDRFQDRPLQDIGGKGLFIKELEEALLDGRAHFAVHSIKDVPAEIAPGCELACVPAREDPLQHLRQPRRVRRRANLHRHQASQHLRRNLRSINNHRRRRNLVARKSRRCCRRCSNIRFRRCLAPSQA